METDRNPRHSPRRATAARRQDLTERLLALAEATIAGAGLGGLHARSLAEAAGCSVGAIYGVFPDLDELILAVNRKTLDAIAAAMEAAGHGQTPGEHLIRLAHAYLDYAAAHRHRWTALFEHRMAGGRPVPPWYLQRQLAAFLHVEAPLAALRPELSPPDRNLLARTLFSAVHGMVMLGLDSKVATMPLPILRQQVETIVTAIAIGLGIRSERAQGNAGPSPVPLPSALP